MPAATKKPEINVLFMAAEAAPLVKVGGLGDVAGSLPPALRALRRPAWKGPRLDVRLVLPFHGEIRKLVQDAEPIATFTVNHPLQALDATAYLSEVEGVPVYLVDGEPIRPDLPVYGSDPALDGERYIFFSLAVLELIHTLDWQVDILHANDWHTAAALYALTLRKPASALARRIRSILTIHNLPFMGREAESAVTSWGLPPSRDQRLPKWALLFPLPLGLVSADHIVAVSPGYAEEILAPEFGCGLQDFLKTRQESISGILNGLDQEAWDPSRDHTLYSTFSIEDLTPRRINKTSLQEDLGLQVDAHVPLLIVISRLDQQKGIDIAIEGLRNSSQLNWQAIILGSGDPLLESACRSLEAEFPDRVRAVIRFDAALARRMYAGGDIILMPSRYEPCGLAQMIAMRYGCLPLARATGGLKDTIRDDPNLAASTGFLFLDPTPEEFSAALERAIYLFDNQDLWQQIQVRAMSQDFSWQKSAIEYARIYSQLMEGRR